MKSMDLINTRNSMLSRLADKLDSQYGYRGDMATADYIPLDQNNARLLISYDPTVGNVTADDVKSYILGAYETKIVPCMESLRFHPTQNCVAVYVKTLRETRPFSDRRSMMAIASTLFMDANMKETWEVNEHDDGTKYLSRVSNESIADIVAERKRRMHVKASAVTFASLQKAEQERVEASHISGDLLEAEMENAQLRRALAETQLSTNVNNVDVGDYIKFYDKGSLFQGDVVKINPAGITVKADNGETFLVSKEAVIGINQKSETAEKDLQKKLKNYFSKAYDYSKKDINTLTKK